MTLQVLYNIYDPHVNHSCSQRFRHLKWMSQALSNGVGAGTTLALWYQLLKVFDSPGPLPPYDLVCPTAHWSDLHLPSICLGILIGLFIGPLLEAIVALRVLIYHSAIRRVSPGFNTTGPRPLYRIL